MKIEGKAKRLTIYLGESDRWHHRPLYQALVERLMEHGVAGATALRGIEGFGKGSRIHTASLLRLSEDLPVMIQVVDREDRIASVLPVIDEMLSDGLVTIEDVDIITYRA